MDPDTPAPPPEARLIRIARNAAGLSADAAAKSTGGAVSPVYWRDVERGYGYRRSQRVPARASDRVLAHMAHAVRVAPDRLEEAGRPDAAATLREILHSDPAPDPTPLRSVPGVPDIDAPAEVVLHDLLERYPDDGGVQYLGSDENPVDSTEERILDILDWLKWRRSKRRGNAGNGTTG
jgi:Helix-turn-helix domain